MDYTGLKVTHSSFGEGTVLSQNEKGMLQIQFANNVIKQFRAPGCFGPDGFLELLNDDASHLVQQELEKEQEEQQQEAARRSREVLFVTGWPQGNNTPDNPVYVEPPRYSSVDDFVSAMQPVLRSEIAAIQTNRRNKTKLADGKLVKSIGNSFIYSFESETELNLPNNTEIELWLPGNKGSIKGHAIDCEGFTVILSADELLGKDVPIVEYTTDTWRLLESLSERLDSIRLQPSSIVKSLVCDGPDNITSGKEIYKGQDLACQMSFSQPITFIWGPPGTGKTKTLADIALQHMSQGHRVLMLSHSNVSVDGATWRVFNKNPQLDPGTIIRYGYPKDKQLLSHDYLTSYNYAIKSHPDLLRTRTEYIKEREACSNTSDRYVELGKKLASLRERLDREEKQAVREARFVATTVSKAVIDKTIFEDTYDVVIFDEASMAYIPQIIFSASLANRHFVCMGDFSQLPPIVQSENANILNCDIFQYCGIVKAVERNACHEWLCLLDTQYRMHPDIADFSGKTMYKNMLKSGDKMASERKSIVNSEPFRGDVLHLVDLSGMYSLCTRVNDGSHINVLSAFTSMGLVINSAAANEVGIITPYKAQARLLHAMSQDVKEKNTGLNDISCATVHQFQGSEKEVVIYDAVDCYVQLFPGYLLRNLTNNYANRLFNVAITRAKGKMITVGNVDYLVDRLANNVIFKQLLNQLADARKRTKGQDVLQVVNSDLLQSYDERSGSQTFFNDLEKATQSISISIPQGMEGDDKWVERFEAILSGAKEKGVLVSIRTTQKDALPKILRIYAHPSTESVFDPIVIVDKKIVWYGMPKSAAQFILSSGPQKTLFHPILRFEGRHFAQTLSALDG